MDHKFDHVHLQWFGSFSDYLEQALLDHTFLGGAFSQPDTTVALYTAAPSDAGGGTEVSGVGYVRKTCTSWGRSGSIMYNSGSVTFAQAGGAWGTVSHFGIHDTATAGNLLAWGTCTAAKAVDENDTAEFASSTIQVSLD